MRTGYPARTEAGAPEAPEARIATAPGNGERLDRLWAVAVALKHIFCC